MSTDGERIAKRIARAGVCSRREAERRIFAGRVSLNGRALRDPAVNVGPDDLVEVDGATLAEPEPVRLWRYHKPAGLVTTDRDPEGRPTVFDSLPSHLPRVISVGRLDLASEGLLLLTNDGALARELELPARGWVRRYRARVRGRVDEERLVRLAGGVEVVGERYGPIAASLDEQRSGNAWLTLSLAEGRNREVRRVLEYLGHPVNRLIRIAYGPFQLGNLPRGAVAEIRRKTLREQLGRKV
ncbi:MAG: pseudouridine synthase [Alphaproteobacteria bacterium]|nr:pseudouridine synthase [Alphaproteobacteria bacterium]